MGVWKEGPLPSFYAMGMKKGGSRYKRGRKKGGLSIFFPPLKKKGKKKTKISAKGTKGKRRRGDRERFNSFSLTHAKKKKGGYGKDSLSRKKGRKKRRESRVTSY